MPTRDEIRLTLPCDRDFHRVAHLVLGGLALRHELTIETLEDLQLALAAVLEAAGPAAEVTVAMTVVDGSLETSVGPLDLREELGRDDGAALGLRRVLWTVADDVALDGDYVRLTKRVSRRG